MKLRFSKSISPVLWALVITTGTPFCKAAWAESLPSVAPNQLMAAPEKPITNQPIEFRTLVPDRPIVLPKKGEWKALGKVGVHITNHSKTKKVFAPNFIRPSLLNDNGKTMLFSACDRTATRMIGQNSFVSLGPGESIEFLYPIYSFWDGSETRFGYKTADGGGCSISGIEAGKYSLSIDYIGPDNALLNELSLWQAWNIDPKTVWQEEVSSIPVTLLVIESQDGNPNP
jgi:hypothetical protein